MAEKYNRRFEGIWIPANIWLSEELTMQEKIFLVEIKSLDNEQGCFASNEHFGKLFQLSKSRCSEVISKLKEKGLITIQLIYKGESKQVEKRVIRVNYAHQIFNEGIRKTEAPIRKVEGGIRDVEAPPSEKAKDNNTLLNNTTNNTKRKKEGDKPLPPTSPTIDTDLLKIKKHFEDHVIYQPAAYVQTKTISDWMDDGYATDLIIKAMDIAVERSKPHLPYINGILKQWRLDGVTNTQQLQAKEVPKHGNTGPANATHTGRTPEEIAMLERLRTYSSEPTE